MSARMWDFIKKIFSEEEGEVTVVVLDEKNPDSTSTFRLKSLDFIFYLIVVVLLSAAFTIGIFFITPLSSIYQQQIDQRFRDQVIAINQRVEALQDSLTAREVQLQDLKNFVRTVPDTTFSTGRTYSSGGFSGEQTYWGNSLSVPTFRMLNQNEIISSTRMDDAPDFPSPYPIEGLLTQQFTPGENHFGVDFAAPAGSEFRSVADGSVVNTGWTINYGYVIYVQHSDGIMSVYKHGSNLYKKQGDIVLKGDLLGRIANSGILSSGSHLHLEIWKDGLPQNPLMYLVE